MGREWVTAEIDMDGKCRIVDHDLLPAITTASIVEAPDIRAIMDDERVIEVEAREKTIERIAAYKEAQDG